MTKMVQSKRDPTPEEIAAKRAEIRGWSEETRRNKLLEDAKSIKTRNRSHGPVTREETELAIAYFYREVCAGQVSEVLNIGISNVPYHCSAVLRAAITQGLCSLQMK